MCLKRNLDFLSLDRCVVCSSVENEPVSVAPKAEVSDIT